MLREEGIVGSWQSAVGREEGIVGSWQWAVGREDEGKRVLSFDSLVPLGMAGRDGNESMLILL